MSQVKLISDELWDGEKSICFFVCLGSFFWIVDDKCNFSLDAEKDYRAYLEKGHITQEQYISACKSFRNGILRLTADNFSEYMMARERHVLSQQDIKNLFEYEANLTQSLHKKVEQYYVSGIALSPEDFRAVNAVAFKLPAFYVNFDRRIYMHMEYGRTHEDLAYADWHAQCSDFCHLIPDIEKYWALDGKDFWKYRFIQSL